MSVRTIEMNAFAEPIDLLTRGNDTPSEKSPRQKAKARGPPGQHLRKSCLQREDQA